MRGRTVVHDGPRWWIADTDGRVVANEGDEDYAVYEPHPYDHLFDPGLLLGRLDVAVRDRVRHAGRRAVRVEAWPRHPAGDDLAGGLLFGGDAYELLVDSERGVLLQTTAFVAGEPAHVASVVEIVFDEPFAPETFSYEPPPGARVRRAPLAPRVEELSLDEAARRAPFRLWKVPQLGAGWTLRVLFVDEDEDAAASANLHYFRDDGAEQFSIVHRPSGSKDSRPLREAQPLTRNGEQLHVFTRPGGGRLAVVWLARDGTSLELHSQHKTAEQLVELAASLVRV